MEVPVYNTPEANSETKQCYSRSGLLPHITQPQDEFQAFLSNWSLDLSLLFTVTMLKQGKTLYLAHLHTPLHSHFAKNDVCVRKCIHK